MKFEWDEEKAKINLDKHGLSFADVELVFNGPTVTFVDDRRDYRETRYVTLGLLEETLIVVYIAHTLRSDIVRLISMRKANGKERKIFEKRLG
jgi:uncharacterized protein